MKQRLAYAAAHVAWRESYRALGHTLERPGPPDEIVEHVDWDATAALRRELDGHGFGIAEAMDTAQRFQVGWAGAERLIRTTGALGLRNGFCAGAGADAAAPNASHTQVIASVVMQARRIQEAGGVPVILPLPHLTRNGCGEEDYVATYVAIVDQLEGPLFVHWLGPMFLPELAGYFPGQSFRRVMLHAPSKVRGAKLSLLDAGFEVLVRRDLLTRDQLLLTGDDFHFAGLILGGEAFPPPRVCPEVVRSTDVGGTRVALGDFSHALLGVLDGIAPGMSAALELLRAGDVDRYLERARPLEELGRFLFQEPTQHYKAGLAFLAWLTGRQPNCMLANRAERGRTLEHYTELARYARSAGAIAWSPEVEERFSRLSRELDLGG